MLFKKQYVLIFLLVTILGCSSTSQIGPTSEPTGQTTGIILKTNQSKDQAFKSIVKYLRDRGFNFQEVDHFTHYLRTHFKTMDEQMYKYQVDAVVPPADSTIIVFRGQVIGPRVQSPAQIRRNSGDISSYVWDYFHTVVTGFPHEKVYYSQN